jgi:phosphate transport system permease protein
MTQTTVQLSPPPTAQDGAGLALPARTKRRFSEIAAERAVEALIHLCGVSAILFVFGIFFFVFREGAPYVFGGDFKLGEFLFSTAWYPTSQGNPRYGVLSLIVGTFSVTALATFIAVPFGLGSAVFVSEFSGNKGRETLKMSSSSWRPSLRWCGASSASR